MSQLPTQTSPPVGSAAFLPSPTYTPKDLRDRDKQMPSRPNALYRAARFVGDVGRSDFVTSTLYRDAESLFYPSDPNFQLNEDLMAKYGDGIPEDWLPLFGEAESHEDAMRIRSDLISKAESERRLQSLGYGGLPLRIAANFLDPVNIALGAATGGLGVTAKATRLANFTRAGLINVATNVPVEAYRLSRQPESDTNDLLLAGVASMGLGGAFGVWQGTSLRKAALRSQKAIELATIKEAGFAPTPRGEAYFKPPEVAPVVPSKPLKLDELQPGMMVRLYRGEGPSQIKGGDWWTTDKALASKYGTLTAVDVPSETLGKIAAQGHSTNLPEYWIQGGLAKLQDSGATLIDMSPVLATDLPPGVAHSREIIDTNTGEVKVANEASQVGIPDARADLELRIQEKMRSGLNREDAFRSAQDDLTREAGDRLATEGEILVDEYGDTYRVNHERSTKGGPKDRKTLTKLTEDGVPYATEGERPWLDPEESLLAARRLRPVQKSDALPTDLPPGVAHSREIIDTNTGEVKVASEAADMGDDPEVLASLAEGRAKAEIEKLPHFRDYEHDVFDPSMVSHPHVRAIIDARNLHIAQSLEAEAKFVPEIRDTNTYKQAMSRLAKAWEEGHDRTPDEVRRLVGAPSPEAPALSWADLVPMTPDDMAAALRKLEQTDTAIAREMSLKYLGKEKARLSDKDASAIEDAIPAGSPDYDRFFGVGRTGLDAEELRLAISETAGIQSFDKEEFTSEIARAVRTIGITESANLTAKQKVAVLTIRRAGEWAVGQGWDLEDITKSALQKVYNAFPDPSDHDILAAIIERYLPKQGGEPSPAAAMRAIGETAPPQVAARTPTERASNGQRQEKGRQEGLLTNDVAPGAGPPASGSDVLSAQELQDRRSLSKLQRVGAGISDVRQQAFDRDVQSRVDAYTIQSQINPDHTKVGVEDVIRAFGWDESRARAAVSDFRAGLPTEPSRAPSTRLEFVDNEARRQMASSLPPAKAGSDPIYGMGAASSSTVTPAGFTIDRKPGELDLSSSYDRLPTGAKGTLGFGISEQMNRSKNPVTPVIGRMLVREAGLPADGSPVARSATEEARRQFNTRMVPFQENYDKAFDAFRKEQGIAVWNRPKMWAAKRDFDRMAHAAAIRPPGAYTSDPAINAAADQWRSLQKEIREYAARQKVAGFEEIPESNMYAPRQWLASKIDRMNSEVGRENTLRWIQGALSAADPVLAKDSVAAGEKAQQLLTLIETQYLRNNENLGIEGVITDLIGDAKYAGPGKPTFDRGEVTRAAARTPLDETFELRLDNGRVLTIDDFVETNLNKLAHTYTMQMVGHAAMAEVYRGATLLNYMSGGLEEVKNYADLIRFVAARGETFGLSAEQIQNDIANVHLAVKVIRGIPLGGQTMLSDMVRNLAQHNYNTRSGQFAFANLHQFITPMAEGGVRAAFQNVPAIPKFIASVFSGKNSDELAKEVVAMTGLGQERILNPVLPRTSYGEGYLDINGSTDDLIRRNLGEGAADFMQTASPIKRAGRAITDLSGSHAVNRLTKEWAASITAQKFLNIAKSGKGFNEARLLSIGLTKEKASAISAELLANAETGPMGRLINPNYAKWTNQQAASDFIWALEKWTSRVTDSADIGEMSKWMTWDAARLLLQFRTFNLRAFSAKTVALGQQVKRGNYAAFATIVIPAVAATLSYVARAYLESVGMNPQRKKEFLESRLGKDGDWTPAILAGASRSDVTSLLPMAIDYGAWAGGYDTPFTNARVSGVENNPIFGNPTWDLVTKGPKAVAGAARSVYSSDYQFSQQDVTNAKALAWWSSLPGVKNIIDYLSTEYLPKKSKKD